MRNDKAKQRNIVNINEGLIKNHMGEIIRSTAEETGNYMLGTEADRLCNAVKPEGIAQRVYIRAGYNERSLETKAGKAGLKMSKLRNSTLKQKSLSIIVPERHQLNRH